MSIFSSGASSYSSNIFLSGGGGGGSYIYPWDPDTLEPIWILPSFILLNHHKMAEKGFMYGYKNKQIKITEHNYNELTSALLIVSFNWMIIYDDM